MVELVLRVLSVLMHGMLVRLVGVKVLVRLVLLERLQLRMLVLLVLGERRVLRVLLVEGELGLLVLRMLGVRVLLVSVGREGRVRGQWRWGNVVVRRKRRQRRSAVNAVCVHHRVGRFLGLRSGLLLRRRGSLPPLGGLLLLLHEHG
jgi:hypothetical protein